jgi:GT2 family glycosyltransferase
MSERAMHAKSGDHSEDPALARHIEATNWRKQVNRRSYDDMSLPTRPFDRTIAELEAMLNDAQTRVTEYEQSTSWRVTAPLRWIKRHISLPSRVDPPSTTAPPTTPYPFSDYAIWVSQDEAACQVAIRPAAIGRTSAFTPRLTMILTAIGQPQDALAATLESLRGHILPPCSLVATCESTGPGREMLERFASSEPHASVLILCDETTAAASKAAALATVETEFLCFLDPPDQIAPTAIRLICEVIALNPETELIFTDEDSLDASGHRSDPFFKPGWDPELQQAGDLLGRLLVLRGDTLRRIDLPTDTSGSDWFQELGERAAAACRPDRIHHIAAILYHRIAEKRPVATDPPGQSEHDYRIDAGSGPSARWKRVRHAIPVVPPMVTLIVPTRDRANLLRTCADGLLNRTDYPNIELLIINNDTQEPDAIKLLRTFEADERVRILSLPGPFNWSSLNNAGAHAARGDILVLLNNDIAILHNNWLGELVSHALRPEIGAVGAKLLYPDGTLQHAGLVIDTDGAAKHILRYAPADTECLNGVLQVARSVSAVTGACLAVRRNTFFEVGGFDESLAVACNDVDFCLRLRAHGYRNVWTPFAVLEHREMASRGPDSTPAMRARAASEINRLSRDWGSTIFVDPYFNPNLVLMDEQPRIVRRA